MSRRWLPPALWAAFILVLTSLPGSAVAAVGDVPDGLDKVVHFTIYGVLGWLCARAMWRQDMHWSAYALLLVIIGVLAALDEWHQTFIPGREANVIDWVTDVTGASAGVALYAAARRRERTA